ncbi:MAG: N-acetylmuramoyl-L-alanine amidase [Muribaculaceae bacterium]|nr:N-acetylmuramoyl-L-alanine amidase [Muribaculaceae bacterium]
MSFRRITILLIITLFTAMISMAAGDVFTVVIDPGHGGKDSGCVGTEAKEKDIVLEVSELLRDKIEKKYGKKVKVIMTRSDDRFVTLKKRAEIANTAKGDLFISIHINSVPKDAKGRSTVEGASVYTCGLHRSHDNLQVAMRENSVMELESDYSTKYKGFDPTSSESYIMFELSQDRHQKQSIQFARLAENALVSHAQRKSKGVRQAGFWVLWATSMPSVLVELDYLCNPTQEKFLKSEKGKDKCASALFEAFKSYYELTM